MANLKGLFKDTAIYGLSSIIGRFLNYLMVPLYTYTLHSCSDYGIYADLYAQTALVLVILTFGMETTFFRFMNKVDKSETDKVYATALMMVGVVALVFVAGVIIFLNQIAALEGYPQHKWYIGMMALVVAQDAIQAIAFAYLRYQHKPYKFAALKLLFIVMSVSLNVLAYLIMPRENPDWEITVKWAFMINLACTTIISLLLTQEWIECKYTFDKKFAKQMLAYTWPLLVLGIAGILNQVAGQIMLPRVLDQQEGRTQLGIYEACVKIAMIMALITQAFRYAYEPIVFGSSKDKDSKALYAKAMKFFIIFTLAAFLCVIAYLDILQFIIRKDYREGLKIVPIVMAAEIMMGIVVNLSFWYKLIDKTIYGAYFSIAGCIVLFVVNFIFMPRIGYMACAWAGFAGYGTTMVLSYLLGQKHNPIDYPLGQIAFYVVIAGMFFALMMFVGQHTGLAGRLGINTLLVLAFLTIILKKEKFIDAIRTRKN